MPCPLLTSEDGKRQYRRCVIREAATGRVAAVTPNTHCDGCNAIDAPPILQRVILDEAFRQLTSKKNDGLKDETLVVALKEYGQEELAADALAQAIQSGRLTQARALELASKHLTAKIADYEPVEPGVPVNPIKNQGGSQDGIA